MWDAERVPRNGDDVEARQRSRTTNMKISLPRRWRPRFVYPVAASDSAVAARRCRSASSGTAPLVSSARRSRQPFNEDRRLQSLFLAAWMNHEATSNDAT